MEAYLANTKLLYGGTRGWNVSDWKSSDDRVRGGASQSHLSPSSDHLNARFYGNLDIKTLGGAGFASQHTADDSLRFDLSQYDGIQLQITAADSKRYTLILKDSLLPKSANGREQASISWEYDFGAGHEESMLGAMVIRVPWKAFKPTYRGREKKDAEPLDTSNVKRLSFMVRSFFGSQEGGFSLTIGSVSAYEGTDDIWAAMDESEKERILQDISSSSSDKRKSFPYPYRDFPEYRQASEGLDEKRRTGAKPSSTSFCGLCG